jgi:hypothetical protein
MELGTGGGVGVLCLWEVTIGQFYFFRTAQEKQAYFNLLGEFYRKAGVAPERR